MFLPFDIATTAAVCGVSESTAGARRQEIARQDSYIVALENSQAGRPAAANSPRFHYYGRHA